MVHALGSSPGLSTCQRHCVGFLSKELYSNIASLCPSTMIIKETVGTTWQNATSKSEMDCRLSDPGRVAVLLAASC